MFGRVFFRTTLYVPPPVEWADILKWAGLRQKYLLTRYACQACDVPDCWVVILKIHRLTIWREQYQNRTKNCSHTNDRIHVWAQRQRLVLHSKCNFFRFKMVEAEQSKAKHYDDKSVECECTVHERSKEIHPRSWSWLSIGRRVKWELRDWIIFPYFLSIQESPQPRHLWAQIHNDDLHLDVKLESEKLLTSLECSRTSRDEHVSLKAQIFEVIYQLTELRTPSQDAQLCCNLFMR